MDPVTLAALAASAIPAIGKIFGGGKQIREATALAASNKFTPYKTPTEILESTDLAQENYLNGMPGQDRAQNLIGTNMGNALQTAQQGASSSGDLIDAATRINLGADQATNGLTQQAAEYKANALQDYRGALGTQATYRDKEYQTNYLDPFIRKANAASSMYGAGQINRSSGWDGLSTSAIAAATMAKNGKAA